MITTQPRTPPADPYSIELTYTHRYHWAGNAEDGLPHPVREPQVGQTAGMKSTTGHTPPTDLETNHRSLTDASVNVLAAQTPTSRSFTPDRSSA